MKLSQYNSKFVFYRIALPVALTIQLLGILIISDNAINMDSGEYLALSKAIYSSQEYSVPQGLNGFENFPGESPTRMRQPGYPLFLVLFYWTLGESVLVVQIAQIALNCLALWFIFMTARELLKNRLRAWAVVFPAIYFPWLLLSTMILSESLFIAFLWAAIFAISRFFTRMQYRYCIISGVMLGILVLIKPIGFVVLILLIAPLVGIAGLRQGLKAWSSVLGSALIIIIPWTVRNYCALGEMSFFPTTSGYNFWVASRPIGSDWWSNSEEFVRATSEWKHYYIDKEAQDCFMEIAHENFSKDTPIAIVGRAFLRYLIAWTRFPGSGNLMDWNIKYMAMSAVQTGMVIFAIIGLIRLKTRKVWLLLFPVIALSVALPITKGLTRYILPGLPAVALLAGQGLLCLVDTRKPGRNRRQVALVSHHK